MRRWLQDLYFGEDRRGRNFRRSLIAFDVLTISLFILSASANIAAAIPVLDVVLGLVIALELVARVYAAPSRREELRTFATAADVVVIASLVVPAISGGLGFLRVFRALRLLRSYRLLSDLRQESRWFKAHEDIVLRTVNLFVFIMVVTSIVFVTQNAVNPQIKTYVDALYFTITTLTTTGFGDITLAGTGGRLLAVVIMVVGVSLFLRLLQAVFRPNKVRFECPDCALQMHDIDAVHCKHCGRVLAIPDEGSDV